MNKIVYFFIMFFLVLTGLGTSVICYLTLFHIPTPIEFHGDKFPIWQEGDNLCFTTNYTRYTDLPVTVTRSFNDGIMFWTQPTMVPGRPLGNECLTRCFPVPSTLPSGEYSVTTNLMYEVNPFATRTVTWESERLYINNENDHYSYNKSINKKVNGQDIKEN
jgi:hypothetical protein